MATTKHTPGPWKAVTSTEKVLDTVINEFGDPVCQLHNGALNFKPDDIEANARLIAAAPDLLEALKVIAEGAGRFSKDPITHAQNCIEDMKALAIAAIAKATNTELSK